MPAKAGIQHLAKNWIPACAGMSGERIAYRTAIGETVEPVPPWIFKGCIMKANS